jgi:hypothetical protein
VDSLESGACGTPQPILTLLGFSFGPHHPYNPSARMYLYMSASPSKKSVQRLKTKVRALLVPSNTDPWPEVRERGVSPTRSVPYRSPPMSSLKGKTLFISGASRGIGLAIALRAAHDGDDKLLYASGVRDFDRYRVDASVPLASDFFVPDDDVPPPGVTVMPLR